MNLQLRLIRAPHSYKYNDLDVREDSILTYLGGYFTTIGFKHFDVKDLHLQRGLGIDDLVEPSVTDYVISVRETGDEVHYVLRIAEALAERTNARIWLYGQTARLKYHNLRFKQVKLVWHGEADLASALGLNANGPSFETGLKSLPYVNQITLQPWQQKRLKATIETTRGCHYGCSFCFINAGKNHPKRWQVRPVESILGDIKTYLDMGIPFISFNDSEFIGADSKIYPQKEELLERIKNELPRIYYMIWVRADTLHDFNRYQLLKDSGLVNAFIGVESFDQTDLDALNKKLDVNKAIQCIKQLRDFEIYSNLSFITFNRNTSVRSIRNNLITLKDLMSKNARYLGTPNFTFSFESSWQGISVTQLSEQTYVGWDVLMKSQPKQGAAFAGGLEPLMEIYRLLSYEWSRKLTELNHERENRDAKDKALIENWNNNLGLFCVKVMTKFLDLFESGRLRLEDISVIKEDLFDLILDYYKVLPSNLQSLSTYRNHASHLLYQGKTNLVEEDEYWADQIPLAKVF